jgi:hypothetical protein
MRFLARMVQLVLQIWKTGIGGNSVSLVSALTLFGGY